MNKIQTILKNIPQVDEILLELNKKEFVDFISEYPHAKIVESIRITLEKIRKEIIDNSIDVQNASLQEFESIKQKIEFQINQEKIAKQVVDRLLNDNKPSLRRVINATGVILHTNLGRSLLSEKAAKMVYEISRSYNNLEYDIEKGERGLRHIHIEKLITDLTGAESCMVVNNNAAATMIVLSSIAKGKEVIASRGELIEIGGSFRIPEVMEQSGAILKEVGTTNKTKLLDYINAFEEDKTAALLKVHTSNYRILGFTEEVTIDEMIKLGKEKNIPAIYDVGSGLFTDLSSIGIDEPTIPEIINKGIDVVMFSGDKLLGGPQAGIIIGKKKYIDLMKKNPLARILRVDKMTIAALYATLFEYFDLKKAKKTIPTYHMLTLSEKELKEKAEKLAREIKKHVKKVEINIETCLDQAGGGAAPTVQLKGYAVALKFNISAEKVERQMRMEEVPIVVRINHDNVLIDVRCLLDEDIPMIIAACERIDKM